MSNFFYSVESFNFSYEVHEKMDTNHFKKHMHAYYEMLFLDGGNIDYVIEDKSYNLKKGDLILINSSYFHFVHSIMQAPYKRYMIQFTDDFLEEQTLIQKIFETSAVFHLSEDSPAVRTLRLLADLWNDVPEQYRKKLCQNMLNTLLFSILSLKGDSPPPMIQSVSKICSELINYINKNLTSLKSLDDLTGCFFFSKTYLSHLFKKEMNISVMQFIRNKKILLAQKLIRAGRKPTEVYEECGFSNYVSFYRAYYHFLGIPPSSKD